MEVRHKTPKMLQAEKRLGAPLEDIITKTYNELGSVQATATKLEISPHTLNYWMLRLGIRLERKLTLN